MFIHYGLMLDCVLVMRLDCVFWNYVLGSRFWNCMLGSRFWNVCLDHAFGICFWITLLEYVFGSRFWNMFLDHAFGMCVWNVCLDMYLGFKIIFTKAGGRGYFGRLKPA